MSDPRDQQLDDYLAGRSDISRAYRQLPQETPPTALDEAIKAAARRQVQARRPRWMRPLSAAAIMLLSVGVLLRMQETGIQPAPGVPLDAAQPAREAGAAAESTHADQHEAAESSALPSPAPSHAPADAHAGRAAPDLRPTPDAAADQPKARPAQPEGPAPRGRAESLMSAPATDAGQPAQAQGRFQDPQAWIDHIRHLHALAREDEARAELKAFRQRFPEYPLPDDLVE